MESCFDFFFLAAKHPCREIGHEIGVCGDRDNLG
jgi:hypothetical protein